MVFSQRLSSGRLWQPTFHHSFPCKRDPSRHSQILRDAISRSSVRWALGSIGTRLRRIFLIPALVPEPTETPDTFSIPPTSLQAGDVPSRELLRQRTRYIAMREGIAVEPADRAVEMMERAYQVCWLRGNRRGLCLLTHLLFQQTVLSSKYPFNDDSKFSGRANFWIRPTGVFLDF